MRRASGDVATDEVDVLALDVGGGEDCPSDRRGGEILDRRTEPGDDPVCVGLAQGLRPRPVTDVDLTCSKHLN